MKKPLRGWIPRAPPQKTKNAESQNGNKELLPLLRGKAKSGQGCRKKGVWLKLGAEIAKEQPC